MDYNHIKNFLEKFKKIIFQKKETEEVVLKIISEEINHTVENSSLKIKNNIIIITGSPILRSEIMIHKKQILEKLKETNNIFIDIK